MKYNIITIGDQRSLYKRKIRATVDFPEVVIPAVDATKVNLIEELEKRSLTLPLPGAFSIGEVGVWLSVFDCWQWSVDNNEELIVFEDDAIVHPHFNTELRGMMTELPEDYDFFTLWVPDNQLQDYMYNVSYDDSGIPTHRGNLLPGNSYYDFGAEWITRVYNGYGNVAQLFSPKGAQWFINRTQETGLYSPVDCYLYQEAHAGRCFGYAPKPDFANIVGYDWPETTVHTTPRFPEIYG